MQEEDFDSEFGQERTPRHLIQMADNVRKQSAYLRAHDKRFQQTDKRKKPKRKRSPPKAIIKVDSQVSLSIGGSIATSAPVSRAAQFYEEIRAMRAQQDLKLDKIHQKEENAELVSETEMSLHQIAEDIDFEEHDAKIGHLQRYIEQRNRLRIKEEKKQKLREARNSRKKPEKISFTLPMLGMGSPNSQKIATSPTVNSQAIHTHGAQSPDTMTRQSPTEMSPEPPETPVYREPEYSTPQALMVAAVRIMHKQQQEKKRAEEEKSATRLRDEFVAARMTQHSFKKTRRSLPNRKDTMQKLENMIYIVNQNELSFKSYLSSKVKNPVLEQTMLGVKKKAMAQQTDKGYSFHTTARFQLPGIDKYQTFIK